MRRLLLGIIIVVASREARASCLVEPAIFGGAPSLPLGCPLVAYDLYFGDPPQVFAERNGTSVDVSGTTSSTEQQIDVRFAGNTADCEVFDHTEPVAFEVHTIDLVGAQVGDVLTIDGANVGTVVDAGTCPTATPVQPACIEGPGCIPPEGEPDPEVDGDPDEGGEGGCSTGGSTGFAIGAIGAAVLLLRRRRRA